MKKVMILTLFIIGLLFLSSCTTTIQKEPCSEFEGNTKDECFHKLAIDTEESLLGICANINGEKEQYDCYIDILMKKVTTYNCQEIFEKVKYIDECNMIQGANMKYVEMCDWIVDEKLRDDCYSENVIFHKLSLEKCNNIKDESVKNECLGIFEGEN
jgi:hypothetical protein